MYLLALGLALVVTVASCRRGDTLSFHEPPNTDKPVGSNLAYLTEEEIDKVIVSGMREAELVEKLGCSSLTNRLRENLCELYYQFPYEATGYVRRVVTTAVTVLVSNSVVVGWRGQYREIDGPMVTPTLVQVAPCKGQKETTSDVTLWIASETAINGWRHVDTPSLPQVGYVGGQPDMAISNVTVMMEGQEVFQQSDGAWVTNYVLQIEVGGGCREALRMLTETNLFRRLVVMIGELPVAAPLIGGPVPDGRLVISSRDRSQSVAVRSALCRHLE